jgi:hypothetical protein
MRLVVLAGTALVLAACSDSPTGESEPEDTPPAALSIALRTDDDADRIQVASQTDPDYPTLLNLCLAIRTSSGWWKGIGFGSVEPSVEGEGTGMVACRRVQPGILTFNFWKAKLFGAHTHVGSVSLNLSAYAGHEIVFTWLQD